LTCIFCNKLTNSRHLTQHASAIAKDECHKLCDRVTTTTLPREIRDIIYNALLEEYNPLPVSNKSFSETTGALLPSPDMDLDTLLKQHWVQAEHTGSQFLQELVETLYENMPVKLLNTPHRATTAFLNRDPFALSLPLLPSTYLKRIIVVVDSFFFRSTNFVLPFHDLPSQDMANRYQPWVVECLQVLESIVNKRCKLIVQVTETWKCLTRVLLYVGPRLRIMKDAGFDIEVWDGGRVVEWEDFV
jgi:hypothetical protein